jgi:hypothetical protein
MGGDGPLSAGEEALEMDLVAINLEETLFVSGEIDDWEAVRVRGIDAIVDMDGDVDPGVPEGPGEVLYVY